MEANHQTFTQGPHLNMNSWSPIYFYDSLRIWKGHLTFYREIKEYPRFWELEKISEVTCENMCDFFKHDHFIILSHFFSPPQLPEMSAQGLS